MFNKIVKLIVMAAIVFTLSPTVALAAGAPHTSYGIVTNGAINDPWTFYRVVKPEEKLIGTTTQQGASIIWRALVGNLPTAWSNGDDSIAFVARETGAGTNAHAGFFAVMNENLSNINPQSYNTSTIRAIPIPAVAAAPGAVNLTWVAAATDASETPQGNNISGYNVYRSTNQANGFVKINAALVAANNYSDSTAVFGTTYYYAIEPVFRGNVALGKYSANSAAISPAAAIPTIISITPNSGTQGQNISVTDLKGTNFKAGATVKLTKAEQADIAAINVAIASATKITCTLPLAAATTIGQWNVVVTNPDAQIATLNNGFTVIALAQVPAAPTNFAGVAQANATSILWTWTDNANNEQGFRVRDNANNSTKVNVIGADIQQATENGLTPNTQITRNIIAYNLTGNSANPAAVASVRTLAALPGGPNLVTGYNDNDKQFIDVSWTSNNNPAITEYAIRFTDENGVKSYIQQNGSTGAQPFWATRANWLVTFGNFRHNNLKGNTTYGYEVKARNADNVETAFTALKSTLTMPAAPTNIRFSNVAPDSVTISWDAAPGATTIHAIYYWTNDPNNDLVKMVALPNLSANLTELLPNTNYNIKIVGFTADGSGTPATASFSTPALPPTITSAHQKNSALNWINVNSAAPEGNLIIEGTNLGGGQNGSGDVPAASSVGVRLHGNVNYLTVPSAAPNDKIYWWQETSIEIGLPDVIVGTTIVAGTYDLQVITPNGTVSSDNAFIVKPKVNPGQTINAGQQAAITGLSFGAGNVSVSFTGVANPVVGVASNNNTITVAVPAGAQTGPVTVTINGQTSVAVNLTVNPVGFDAPNITGAHQKNSALNWVYINAAAPEGNLVIDGTNFDGTADGNADAPAGASVAVKLHADANYLTIPSAAPNDKLYWWQTTSIEIGLPESIGGTNISAGTYDLQVTTSKGTKVLANAFAVKPKVNSNLTVNAGQQSVITGTALGTGNVSVSFTGVANPVVGVASNNNTITVAVPAGAQTGPVTVTINGQTSVAVNLTVNPVGFNDPTISGILSEAGNTWANVYDKIIISGSNFGDVADGSRSTQQNHVTINGLQVVDVVDPAPEGTIQVYAWTTNRIELGIPREVNGTYITAGDLPIIVTIGNKTAQSQFEVRPKIYGFNPGTGIAGQPITINGTALGIDPLAVSASFNGVNTAPTAVDNGTATFTIPQNATTGPVIVTVNGKPAAALNLTIAQPGQPRVTNVAPLNAKQGETVNITITGADTSFAGDMKNALHFSGAGITINSANATNATTIVANITLASDAALGIRTIAIDGVQGTLNFTVNDKGGVTPPVTPEANTVVIDDYEGNLVGKWEAPNKESGYYVFDKHDANDPASPAKTTSYPERALDANAYEGAQAMKVTYSYGNRTNDPAYAGAQNDWGGGWGAKLIKPVDLNAMNNIVFYIKWDGSSNGIALALKDSDGTSVKYELPAGVSDLLKAQSNFGSVGINKGLFTYDAAGSVTGADKNFNWGSVAGYNFIYTGKNASSNSHYIDYLAAVTTMPTEEPKPPVVGDKPVINTITPNSSPAGAKIVVEGTNFGDLQGQGTLTFTNKLTRQSYPAEIISWSNGKIEALAPKLGIKGDYDVKVNKAANTQGVITIMESNPVDFSISAAGAAETITAYPNPFNGGKEVINLIVNDAKGATNISFIIYDMTAKIVYQATGAATQITWDGYDTHHDLVADGAYLVRVINENTKTLLAKGKILVVKR